jgi:hypothetical protein
MLLEGEYLEAKRVSERIASEVPTPLFYVDKAGEVEASREAFEGNRLVQEALAIVEASADSFGHGLTHVRKVAVDAGALVIIEMRDSGPGEELDRVLLLAHLAGVLHDIKRMEPEHAQRGAEEAATILLGFDLADGEREAITQAIRNHEAFKPAAPMEGPSMQLLSDALYDADKFRWGPDNFTETLWMMIAPMKVPLGALLRNYRPSLEGIVKIKSTFRTWTGKEYGPDFIDKGLEIGERIYLELSKILAEREDH